MHYKTVANLLDRHDADQQVVRIRVKNPRASIIMTGTVNGEPRYISKRGCFCIPIKLGKRKFWLRCPDISRIERV
jgi:hypothetical protein